MSDEILFVTSFGTDMYEVTGKPMLDSFNNYQSKGKLLVCREGDWAYNGNEERIFYHDLDKDEWLQQWLQNNRDVIPVHLGGLTTECTCPGRAERHGQHRKGCHWAWMNRNASRWFRKVASFRIAAQQRDYRYIVWVDADCVFHKGMPALFPRNVLNGAAMAYCRGPHREAIESGILLFDMQEGGRKVIKELCRRYTSREYLQDHRWDDGFQITRVADKLRGLIRSIDLSEADRTRRWKKNENKQNVIPRTILAKYLDHKKGMHGRVSGIMK